MNGVRLSQNEKPSRMFYAFTPGMFGLALRI